MWIILQKLKLKHREIKFTCVRIVIKHYFWSVHRSFILVISTFSLSVRWKRHMLFRKPEWPWHHLFVVRNGWSASKQDGEQTNTCSIWGQAGSSPQQYWLHEILSWNASFTAYCASSIHRTSRFLRTTSLMTMLSWSSPKPSFHRDPSDLLRWTWWSAVFSSSPLYLDKRLDIYTPTLLRYPRTRSGQLLNQPPSAKQLYSTSKHPMLVRDRHHCLLSCSSASRCLSTVPQFAASGCKLLMM